jgi:hypothetical protein
MTQRHPPYRMPPGYQPTPAEKRVMTHILKAFSAEIAVLQEDGMVPRAIVVGLLMSAVKLAAASDAISPDEIRGFVEAILERYTEGDFEE